MQHKLFLSHLLLLLSASFSIEIAIFFASCQKFQKLINFSSSNGNFIFFHPLPSFLLLIMSIFDSYSLNFNDKSWLKVQNLNLFEFLFYFPIQWLQHDFSCINFLESKKTADNFISKDENCEMTFSSQINLLLYPHKQRKRWWWRVHLISLIIFFLSLYSSWFRSLFVLSIHLTLIKTHHEREWN
jgi:hypothetical protein